MSKPREWVIDDAYDLVAGPHPGQERIEVVEKSAYEKAIRERDEARAKSVEYGKHIVKCDNHIARLDKQLTAAGARSAKLVEALNKIGILWHTAYSGTHRFEELTREIVEDVLSEALK